MAEQIITTGPRLCDALQQEMENHEVSAVGFAYAYVSVYGITKATRIVASEDERDCRLVAGIDDCVTHPEALRRALTQGWRVRVTNGHRRAKL